MRQRQEAASESWTPLTRLGKARGRLMWQLYIPDAHTLEWIKEHFFYGWEASYRKSKWLASFAPADEGPMCEKVLRGSLNLWGLLHLEAKGPQGRGTKRRHLTFSLPPFKMGVGNCRKVGAKVTGKLFHLAMKTFVNSLSLTFLPAACPTTNVAFLISVK